ncbi:MAG: UDP-N-acetylglucosamine--N-acetylmuramyl-(pentapeptide) pyrophosphoryl-undecaprenol N-acetylglucosamine transferase [Candidatus Caldatribacteriaceae bacterium]
MRIFIGAGGTGGHVFPSLCVARKFREVGECEVFFLGTRRGLERRVVESLGFPMLYVFARGWDRKFSWRTMQMLGENFLGLVLVGFYFFRYRPSLFLAMGSYLSLLGALWAKIFRIPIYLHEQNVYPGLANRVIAKWAKKVFLSFEETKGYLPCSNAEVVVTGNPIREETAVWKGRREEARRVLGLCPSLKTILVMGGSRGSSVVNRVFLEALEFMPQKGFQVIHITGEEDFTRVVEEAKRKDFPYLVFPFFESMGLAYAASNVALCRAGANTVTELYFFGIPGILVPYGEATENHQLYNARWLEKKRLAIVVEEEKLRAPFLAEKLLEFLHLADCHGAEDGAFLEKAASRITQEILSEWGRKDH